MTASDLFIDLSFICLLLLVGAWLRAKVKFIQALFLPASLIAGALGLLLGPNGLGVIPFSEVLSSYAGLLIAVVFAALPFTSKISSFAKAAKNVATTWAVSQSIVVLQWGVGLLLVLGVVFILGYYGIAYVPIGFVDIAIIALLPVLVMNGMAWPAALVLVAVGVLLVLLATFTFAPVRPSGEDGSRDRRLSSRSASRGRAEESFQVSSGVAAEISRCRAPFLPGSGARGGPPHRPSAIVASCRTLSRLPPRIDFCRRRAPVCSETSPSAPLFPAGNMRSIDFNIW